METSILNLTQKYAAAGLLAMALHQSQIHQTPYLISSQKHDEPSDDPHYWIHTNSGLLSPIFRFMGVDTKAGNGLYETAKTSSQDKQHIRSFLTLLSDEAGVISSESKDKELALSKAVDAMELTLETTLESFDDTNKCHEYEIECCKKYSNADSQLLNDMSSVSFGNTKQVDPNMSIEQSGPGSRTTEKPFKERTLLSYPRKVTILYELLSACLADNEDSHDKFSPFGKVYDARHRVALRLLTTWLDVQWIKMEILEILVASSLMDSVAIKGEREHETKTPESPMANWKRGGIIGAAALTGGTLMAITGGIAAPAIAEGVSALAPMLGGLVPAVGASGFAAAASATGSVTGSVALAASFGVAGAGLTGSKMARRIGDIDEFEFKAIGENHNQDRLAVGILISGLVFEEKDFVKPWEGHNDNLERYALHWESKNLIAASTAIQDWLTSRIAMELMKEGAMMTVLSTVLMALALPATLLTVTDIIDSKWAIAVDRSDKAGKMLAEILLKRLQGYRPVTLIGYSLGARVIFRCLQSLAETEGFHVAGLVERVVLLGAPVSIKDEHWENARKVCSYVTFFKKHVLYIQLS